MQAGQDHQSIWLLSIWNLVNIVPSTQSYVPSDMMATKRNYFNFALEISVIEKIFAFSACEMPYGASGPPPSEGA